MTESTTDINELFSRDPLSLTDNDITAIIHEMRKRRQLFKTGPAPKSGSASKTLTEKQKKAASLDIDIDI